MKLTLTSLLALISAFVVVPVFAGSQAGDDSARHYKSNAAEYDGKKVDVDVAFVTRIIRKDRIDEVAFFIAHTVDDDNGARGGSIIVAVLEEDADSFIRKYGTAMERRGNGVETKRLRGVFHQLTGGRVYIDESGEAHALIEAHRKEHGDSAIPVDSEGAASGGRKNKKS